MSGVQTCALRSEEHTSELQSQSHLVCRLLLEKRQSDEGVPGPLRGSDLTDDAAQGGGLLPWPACGLGPPSRRCARRRTVSQCFFFFKGYVPPRTRPSSLPAPFPA